MPNIVGHGDVARSILRAAASHALPQSDRIYFASGVSNSREKDEAKFFREKSLLLQQQRNRHLVYFGSLSVFYAKTRYTQHKLEMEKLVREQFPLHTIMRLGTITWGENPHTIINSMREQHRCGQRLNIQDTTRYVLTEDEFHHWLAHIPDWPCEMNVTGQLMSIRDLVKTYVIPATQEVYG